METIIVCELVPGADTVNEGKQVGAALGAALNKEQLVSLSFSNIMGDPPALPGWQ